jgi:hypothetical protein
MLSRSPNPPREAPMLDARVAAAEREAVLDQILTDLWKGKLTREAAVGRIMVKLGMDQRAARDEVDGFLRD